MQTKNSLEMKERIFKVMKWTGLNLSQFADAIQVSPALLSSVKSERTKPTLLLVENIKKVYPDIDINWLITGSGNMIVGSSAEPGLCANTNDTTPTEEKSVTEPVAIPTNISVVDPLPSSASNENTSSATPASISTSRASSPSISSPEVQHNMPSNDMAAQNCDNTSIKAVKHLLLLFNDGTYETYEKSM